jgi:diguanylate cyclase (GGDEF)-like protein
MLDVIDSVADLTDSRDKDALEITLATVMFELIEASNLILWRLVRHHDEIRLRQRVRLQSAGVATTLDDAFTDPTDLPLLESRADLRACYDARLHLRQPPDENGICRHVFPVTQGRDVVGLLEILRSSPLREDQERLIFGMLRIYLNHLGILDFSDCDDLTGLLNRRTFDESFRRIAKMSAAERGKNDFASIEQRRPPSHEARAHLGVVDIDFFKRVNDQFGHPYGDEVLVLLARLMLRCFRDTDRLYRFGGEEFLVILPGTTPHEAELALGRFRAAVEAFDFPQVKHVTVSIGYTVVLTGDTGANAFGRADEALYVAKQSGRNQIRSYETLVYEGVLTSKPVAAQDVELF